jgi:hypothetical protein
MISMVNVRAATPGDALPWFELRFALWPADSGAEHRNEITQQALEIEPQHV